MHALNRPFTAERVLHHAIHLGNSTNTGTVQIVGGTYNHVRNAVYPRHVFGSMYIYYCKVTGYKVPFSPSLINMELETIMAAAFLAP